MPRNDIFCNYLNLKQKVSSQPKNVQGDTWYLEIILESKQAQDFAKPWTRKQSAVPQ